MKILCLYTVAIYAIFSFKCDAYASSLKDENHFYNEKEEGWFFYKDPPKEEEIEETLEVQKKNVFSPEETTEPNLPAIPVAKDDEAEFGTVAWIKANLEKAKETAIDNPTEENIERWALIQRLMMDKAENFTIAAQRVVQGNPLIDETIRRPANSFGVNAIDTLALKNKNARLAELAQKAGIWYFYSSTCPYCSKQSQVLRAFAEQYDFTILPISVDGGPDPANIFHNFRINENQAQELQVRQTPSLFLASPENQPVAIARGLISFDEMRNNVLIAAIKQGILSEEEWGNTRAVKPLQREVKLEWQNNDGNQLKKLNQELINFLKKEK